MFVVLDIETSVVPHVSPWDVESFICSVGMESSQGKQWVWLLSHVTEPARGLPEAIREIQEVINQASTLVMHNAKFDLAWLKHLGIKISCPVWCTMVGDYILYGQNPDVELSLNACCKRRQLPIKKDLMAEFWKEGFETNEIPWNIHREYLQNDVHITKLLYEKQVKEVAGAKLTHIVQYTSQVALVLAEMEYNGIKFDKDKALQLWKEYRNEAEELRLLMFEYTNFEFLPTSSKQLQTVMFGGEVKSIVQELVAKRRKNKSYRVYTRKVEITTPYSGLGIIPHISTYNPATNSYSTDRRARQLMECPNEFTRSFKRVLDRWALVNKAWTTVLSEDESKGWMTKVQMDGCIHPTFNNCFTRTGRLSSSNPNAQNLARYGDIKLKEIFVPTQDYILSCDLSQIEWRMAAALSEDVIMCKEIVNGMDCHTENGEKFFGVDRNDSKFRKTARQFAKIFNFRMIYGGGASAFANDPQMPRSKSLDWWKSIVNGFKEKYRTLTSWQKKNLKLVEVNKYLRNTTGRILTFFYNCNPDEGMIGYKPTDVCNYPVQSVSADLIYIVLLEMHKFIHSNNYKSKIILQVHDSIVFDVPKEEAYIIARQCLYVMKNLPDLSERYYGWKPCVPIEGEASLGLNYGQSLVDVTVEDLDKIKEVIASDFHI